MHLEEDWRLLPLVVTQKEVGETCEVGNGVVDEQSLALVLEFHRAVKRIDVVQTNWYMGNFDELKGVFGILENLGNLVVVHLLYFWGELQQCVISEKSKYDICKNDKIQILKIFFYQNGTRN